MRDSDRKLIENDSLCALAHLHLGLLILLLKSWDSQGVAGSKDQLQNVYIYIYTQYIYIYDDLLMLRNISICSNRPTCVYNISISSCCIKIRESCKIPLLVSISTLWCLWWSKTTSWAQKPRTKWGQLNIIEHGGFSWIFQLAMWLIRNLESSPPRAQSLLEDLWPDST